ncbi:ribonuclease P protein component [Rathayibacter tritici]|uniref:Ribonuclease P protein component n=1 Tax=Rathayibacter tritici TaxID=33888 RepID=A0A160KVN7_9MICO|nr:ribonuclease P protein component [Rathayibacter tritici]AND18036.1 ribonuclease P protein component [Rathayibacter tritici]PPF29534.1 ribonuclease P protein component [Rathayibacter tritici]PPF69751.1 ribonuclease P protein component [Rathayibacter tritici]PPG09219.1 ribonuclease P protein component [Rathayibacter tritici]PPI18292.1 ribonuclease P protein component [Rathayibacter tritici]
MLARANRIVHGGEYRTVVRRGVRSTGPHTVTYVRRSSAAAPARFGFIVAKTVGTAVTRNTVRRRLKAVAFELVREIDPGTQVVVRALPGSADAAWSDLRAEVATAMARALRKSGAPS